MYSRCHFQSGACDLLVASRSSYRIRGVSQYGPDVGPSCGLLATRRRILLGRRRRWQQRNVGRPHELSSTILEQMVLDQEGRERATRRPIVHLVARRVGCEEKALTRSLSCERFEKILCTQEVYSVGRWLGNGAMTRPLWRLERS